MNFYTDTLIVSSLKKEILYPENHFPIVSELKVSKIYNNYIEINILPADEKVCSYDCRYCNLGKTITKINAIKNISFPSSPLIINAINEKFSEIILSDKKIDTILISGNGEASLHPQFNEISQALSQWKQKKSLGH